MFSTQAKKFDVRILQFKPKLLKKDQLSDYPIGIEYNTDLLTDTQLIRKIFESNSYLPKKEFIIDFNYEISKILVLKRPQKITTSMFKRLIWLNFLILLRNFKVNVIDVIQGPC